MRSSTRCRSMAWRTSRCPQRLSAYGRPSRTRRRSTRCDAPEQGPEKLVREPGNRCRSGAGLQRYTNKSRQLAAQAGAALNAAGIVPAWNLSHERAEEPVRSRVRLFVAMLAIGATLAPVIA